MRPGKPFPGMDPFLEDPALWPGFHDALITYLHDSIQERLPERYYAGLQHRLYLQESSRWILPDVRLDERQGETALPAAPARGEACPTLVVAVPDDEVREGWIEIRDTRSGDRLVTVIEVLSPENKRPEGEGRHLYREKQRSLLRSRSNLVEIDLLRGGAHTVCVPEEALPEGAAYCAVVRRATRPVHREVYAIGLRDRLPRIGVPLLDPDPDLVIDLADPAERAWRSGAYWKRIDYAATPPGPPLGEADLAWVRERVREIA